MSLLVFLLGAGIAPFATADDSAKDDSAKKAPSEQAANPGSRTGPVASADDPKITRELVALLNFGHLTQHALDNEMSRRTFDSFFDALDPMKSYFYKSDIERLSLEREKLDDSMRMAQIDFAYKVYDTFLERVDERMKTVKEMLGAEHDFTVEEKMAIEPDNLDFPKDAAEAKERWRKRIKYDLMLERIGEREAAKEAESGPIDDAEAMKRAVATLDRRYISFARRMHQTDRNSLLELYLGSLTTSYDPHTTYMSPRSVENFEISMKLELDGIGAALRNEDGYTVVSQVIPGGAADRDGRLKEQDKIVSVGQGPDGELVNVEFWNLSDVVPMVRGKRGTIVRLEVIPNGETVRTIYDITRDKIELRDSDAHGEVIEFVDGNEGETGVVHKIGVIDLPSFYRDMTAASQGATDFKSTTRDVKKILEDFEKQGVEAVLIDLRRNGGGSLTEAIELTGLFIDKGPVVQVRNSIGKTKSYKDKDRGTAWDGPLVVLTSKFSASASEILAGAVQDYGRGLVVGDPATHGKGTVQTLIDLGAQIGRNFGALKITTQQFYRPTGDSTQNRGVLTDVQLPSVTQHLDVAEADLDYSVEFNSIPAVDFDAVGMVTPQMKETLQSLSKDRVAKSDEFAKLDKRVERYLARRDRTEVTLNEKAYEAERAALRRDEEEEEDESEDDDVDGKKIKRDFYLNEALSITRDYIRLLLGDKVAVH